jgi:hypothetical protein
MVKKRSDSQTPPAEQGMAPQPSPATEWDHHEHVTPPMKAQAKKLVEEAGTRELAKYAIDAASEPDPAAADKDEFARGLGFTSYLDLFEASTRAASADGKNWFISALRGGSWVVWNETDMIASHACSSPDEARRQLPGNAGR